MNGITFLKGQGGVPKSLPGEDHISGLLLYSSDLPVADEGVAGFSTTNRIINIGTIEQAEALGIKPYDGKAGQKFDMVALHYHLTQVFRINPAVNLYVGIFAVSSDFAEIKQMQEFAEGSIRQMGVYAPTKKISTAAVTGADLTAIQGVCAGLELEGTPLSVLYSATVDNVSTLENLSGVGKCNVSVLVGQDGAGVAAAIYGDAVLNPVGANKKSVGCVGVALGCLSKAAVHESIAWVQKFPTGVDVPAFGDGSLVKNLSSGVIEGLNSKRFVFMIKHAGITGAFFNDSHTMDMATSDYAFVEAVRTIDKAVRGVRVYLTPYIASPLYINAETGELEQGTVVFLQTVAGKVLEQMAAGGELSGYVVEIDPKQKVLETSTLEVVIKQVGVGVMRKINVKIGFTTKLK